MFCGKHQTNQKTSVIVGESHLFGHEGYHTVPMIFSFCKEHHGLVQYWVSGIGSSGCLRKDPQWPNNTGQSQANNQKVDEGILDFQTKPYIALYIHRIPSCRENNQEPPDLYIGGIGKKNSEDFSRAMVAFVFWGPWLKPSSGVKMFQIPIQVWLYNYTVFSLLGDDFSSYKPPFIWDSPASHAWFPEGSPNCWWYIPLSPIDPYWWLTIE